YVRRRKLPGLDVIVQSHERTGRLIELHIRIDLRGQLVDANTLLARGQSHLIEIIEVEERPIEDPAVGLREGAGNRVAERIDQGVATGIEGFQMKRDGRDAVDAGCDGERTDRTARSDDGDDVAETIGRLGGG